MFDYFPMKRIRIKDQDIAYPEDCRKIQSIFLDEGYEISIGEAQLLWKKYSNDVAASWLTLDSWDDDMIWGMLLPYWEDSDG